MKHALVLIVALVAGQSFAAELASDAEVLDIFREVLRRGFFGSHDAESAAFVLRESDGRYRSITWPECAMYHAAHYVGAIPRGTVAIVHTHPNSLPLPSANDQTLAMRLGMPVYCVTLMTVYKADEHGETIAVVKNLRWSRPSIVKRQWPGQGAHPDLLDVCGGRLTIGGSSAYRTCEW